MFQFRLISCANYNLGKFSYLFTRSLKKTAFFLTKFKKPKQLASVASYNSFVALNNSCSKQQLCSQDSVVSKINSSFLKFWFFELSLVGLGFRFAVKDFGFSFRLNIGYSHSVLLPVGVNILLLKRKKRCLLISSNFFILRKFVFQLLKLRKLSKYKLKGLQLKGTVFKLKPGKRSK